MPLCLEPFRTGPLDNNLFLLWDDAARQGVIVDPSIGADDALQRARELRDAGVTWTAIWNTHGHFDHVYDNARWRREFDVPVVMHPADEFLLPRLREQSLWFGLPAPDIITPDAAFHEDQTLHVGAHPCRVLEVPGHSPGSVAFYFDAEGAVISGDVLFHDSIGRVDLPGAVARDLKSSLARLCALPPRTRVLPGHGDETTVARELASNPFCRFPFSVRRNPDA